MRFKLVGIGEVLWDMLPDGRKLGGAPANFAYHARALGADARVVSRVGDDALGAEILERLKAIDVPTYSISVDPTYPTGSVNVELAAEWQPRFTVHENVAWDYLKPEPELLLALAGADAVCFGTLGQRYEPARSSIRTLVAKAPRDAIRVFDMNLRQHFDSPELIEKSLELANVLKLSDSELPTVSRQFGLGGSVCDQLAALLDKFELRLVACTRGADGSLLYDGKDWCDFPGIQSGEVKDTIGAGASFTAALTLGMLAGWPLEKISRLANEVAAYVCTFEGATPPMPDHFRTHFQSRISTMTNA